MRGGNDSRYGLRESRRWKISDNHWRTRFWKEPGTSNINPIIDCIKENLGNTVFDGDIVLTADTGFSSETNMAYIFEENINAVIPDNQFRKRNPVFVESELYNRHNEERKKTRKDKAKTNAAIPSG
jgi:hypothetical protein